MEKVKKTEKLKCISYGTMMRSSTCPFESGYVELLTEHGEKYYWFNEHAEQKRILKRDCWYKINAFFTSEHTLQRVKIIEKEVELSDIDVSDIISIIQQWSK